MSDTNIYDELAQKLNIPREEAKKRILEVCYGMAHSPKVAFVLRVLDYDLVNDLDREDVADEIMSSGSVYKSAAGAQLAVVEDIKLDHERLVNNGEVGIDFTKVVWTEDTYTDYAGAQRKEWRCKVEETTTIYRIVEVFLHD